MAMKRFYHFLADNYHLQKLSNISSKHLVAYVLWMQEKGLSASTIKTDLAAIRFFHDKISNAKYTLPTNAELGVELERRRFGVQDRTWSTVEFSRMLELAYRNLALNVADQHDVEGCYPHAKANVETRGESVFAARNAIDGNCANSSHGLWPFQSWGINRDPNACFTLEFGRPVSIDRMKIWLRADFPHDAWWTEGTVTFSDGSQEVLQFEKTDRGQVFNITPRTISWLTFDKLIKADDPSPFPALTQIAVYGKEV